MQNERIISLRVSEVEFANGPVDVTARLYEVIPEDQIEAIKYMVPNATESGIYFTVVLIQKKVKQKGIMGYKG